MVEESKSKQIFYFIKEIAACCNRQKARSGTANKNRGGGMTARFLFQVTALPLMHLSFLFNPNPFTATFAFMAKGAKRSQIVFRVLFLGVPRLAQMTVKCAEYIETGFSFLLCHCSEYI